MIKTSRTILFSLLSVVLFSGCAKRETAVEIGNREQILHIGIGAEPQDLDPHTTTGNPEYQVQSSLFEALVEWGPGHTDPIPGCAERWDISEDGLVYTFHLRPNAAWSNGDPLMAQDFVFTFNRLFSPNLSAQYAYMYYCIKNSEPFTKGKITDFSQVGVKAVDDKTLEFTLESPTPYFLRLVRYRTAFPVHSATILAHGKMDERSTKWTRPENFISNGPFKLISWEPNRKIIAAKSDTYWDKANTKLNGIHFYPIDDMHSEERAFRTGQLHITKETPPERIKYYQENEPEIIRLEPWLGTYFYELNNERPPLDDVRVRRALALALDREKIVKYVCKAGEPAAYSLTPPNTAGYTARARVEYDPEQARQLLSEAGFPNGEGFPKMEILYNNHTAHAQIAEVIQQLWKAELGIDLELLNMEWKTYIDQKNNHKFDVARASWIGDYIDPTTFLEYSLSDSGNNDSAWVNKEYDALVKKASVEMDQEKRYELFQQAEEILMQEVPLVPIYYYRNKSLVRKSVKDWFANPIDRHPYKYVYLEVDE